MRAPRALAVLSIVALLLSGVPFSLRPSPTLAANATIVVSLNSSTKVFDLGPGNNQQPDGWTTPNFDVSLWDHAARVSESTAACIHTVLGPLGHLPFYRGPTANDYYLIRLPFSVPAASSYNGSSVSIANYDGGDEVTLTDSNKVVSKLTTDIGWGLHVFSVGSLLKPGINLLGLFEAPSGGCGTAIGVRISIQAQGVKGGVPAPRPIISSGPAVALSFPANHAIVTGSDLPLAWRPYPHAAAYLVHVWLIKADPGQALGAGTVATTAMTVLGTRATVSTANMLKGVYGWDVAALNGGGALIAGWGAPRDVQLE